MDKVEAIAAVKRFSSAIQESYKPQMIVLFGSYVRGSQTESSDIDVAVVVDRVEGDFLEQLAGLYRERRAIDDRIEPILLEAGRDRSGFLSSIMKTGEVIFQK